MDIRWLQDFLTVAEVGNFTRAAELRNASQAAFSRRIQSLEIWLGVTLIDRSGYPTRLTLEGERFREDAAEIMRQVLDARAGAKAPASARPDQIRIALPHPLAIGRFPQWWARWSEGRQINCQVEVGNVHDMVNSLIASEVDLFVGFHHAQQPIHLDPGLYDRLEIGTENLRPYVATPLAEKYRLPGTQSAPLPLIMYAPGSYLSRMADLAVAGGPTPLVGRQVFSCDMADVIRRMIASGYGIGWLPDCCVEASRGDIVPIDDGHWSLKMSIIAHRDLSKRRASVDRLWAAMSEYTLERFT